MFKKLRNRILIFNMVVTTLLVVGSFVLVWVSSYLVIQSGYDARLTYTYTEGDGLLFTISRGTGGEADPLLPGDSSAVIAIGTLPLMSSDGYSATLNLSLDSKPSFTALVQSDGERVRLRALILFNSQGEEFCRVAAAYAWMDAVAAGMSWDTGLPANRNLSLNGVDLRYSIVPVDPFSHSEFQETTEGAISGEGARASSTSAVPEATGATGGAATARPTDSASSTGGTNGAGGTSATLAPAGMWYQINFIDTTIEGLNSNALVLVVAVVGIVVVALIFFISLLFARRAVKPIENMYEQQRRLVADASHELKTPLATIMANYDVVTLDEQATVGTQREWLQAMRTGMDRMRRTIAGLLALAQAEDSHVARLADEDIRAQDLSEIVADELRLRENEIATRGLAVTQALDKEAVVRADEERLRQLIAILIDNALTYSDTNGSVDCTLERRGRQVVLAVSNTGPGIPTHDLPHVFERFYRVDKARSSENGNVGLGLAIAQSLVERLGGRIEVESTPAARTTFTVTLPAA